MCCGWLLSTGWWRIRGIGARGRRVAVRKGSRARSSAESGVDAVGPADGYEQGGPGLVTPRTFAPGTDAAFAGHDAEDKVMAWMNVLSPPGSFSLLVVIRTVEVRERSDVIGRFLCGRSAGCLNMSRQKMVCGSPKRRRPATGADSSAGHHRPESPLPVKRLRVM